MKTPNREPVMRLAALAMKDGHSVIYVGPDIQLDDAPYAYTAGRALADHPELLISGPFDMEEMRDMLDEAAEMQAAWGLPVGKRVTLGEQRRLVEVRPCRSTELLHGCDALFGPGRFEVLQLAWADTRGNFPGDADYDMPQAVQTIYGE